MHFGFHGWNDPQAFKAHAVFGFWKGEIIYGNTASEQVAMGQFGRMTQREYVEWIAEAKTEETRDRRLAEAVKWMSEGKPRMWKYLKK